MTNNDPLRPGILPGENQWPGGGFPLPRLPQPGQRQQQPRQRRSRGQNTNPQSQPAKPQQQSVPLPIMPGLLPMNANTLFPTMTREQSIIASYGSMLYGPAMIEAVRRRQQWLASQQAPETGDEQPPSTTAE